MCGFSFSDSPYPRGNCIFSSSGMTFSYVASYPSSPILDSNEAKSRSNLSTRSVTAGVNCEGSIEANLGRDSCWRSAFSVVVVVENMAMGTRAYRPFLKSARWQVLKAEAQQEDMRRTADEWIFIVVRGLVCCDAEGGFVALRCVVFLFRSRGETLRTIFMMKIYPLLGRLFSISNFRGGGMMMCPVL
jgi:hypothetical protein